jgi:hypothetical protein
MKCQEEKFDLERCKAYKEHVLAMENLLAATINKFKEIENKNINHNP